MTRQNSTGYLESVIPAFVIPTDVVQTHLASYESGSAVINRMIRGIETNDLDHDLVAEFFGYSLDLDALNKFPNAKAFLLGWLQNTAEAQSNSSVTELQHLGKEFGDILSGLKKAENLYLSYRRDYMPIKVFFGFYALSLLYMGRYYINGEISGPMYILFVNAISFCASIMGMVLAIGAPNGWCNDRKIQDVIEDLSPALIEAVPTTLKLGGQLQVLRELLRGFTCFTKVEDESELQDSLPTQIECASARSSRLGMFQRHGLADSQPLLSESPQYNI